MDMREIIIHTPTDIYIHIINLKTNKKTKSNNKKCIKHRKTNTKNINKEKVLSKMNTEYYFIECLGWGTDKLNNIQVNDPWEETNIYVYILDLQKVYTFWR